MAPLLDPKLDSSWGMGLETPLWMDPKKIEGWSARRARWRFLERFEELYPPRS